MGLGGALRGRVVGGGCTVGVYCRGGSASWLGCRGGKNIGAGMPGGDGARTGAGVPNMGGVGVLVAALVGTRMPGGWYCVRMRLRWPRWRWTVGAYACGRRRIGCGNAAGSAFVGGAGGMCAL